MTSAAPRIDPRLLAAAGRLAKRRVPAAEACRRLGALADQLGLTRPSYQTVRVLLVEIRRARERPATGEVTVEIAARARVPEALVQHFIGTLPARRIT